MTPEFDTEDLPAPIEYWSPRCLCLVAALMVAAVVHNSAGSPSTLFFYTMASGVAGLILAAWCSLGTAQSGAVRKRKFIWFTLASTGFVLCLHVIFALEQIKQAGRESGQPERFSEALSPLIQLAMFAFSMILAWSMVYLMAVVETPEPIRPSR